MGCRNLQEQVRKLIGSLFDVHILLNHSYSDFWQRTRTESLFNFSLVLLYFLNFTSFLVKDSSIIFNREDVIGLWNKSWYLCCTTSLIVVPPLLSFFKGVIILSIKPEVPSSKYLPSLIPAINFVICNYLLIPIKFWYLF